MCFSAHVLYLPCAAPVATCDHSDDAAPVHTRRCERVGVGHQAGCPAACLATTHMHRRPVRMCLLGGARNRSTWPPLRGVAVKFHGHQQRFFV